MFKTRLLQHHFDKPKQFYLPTIDASHSNRKEFNRRKLNINSKNNESSSKTYYNSVDSNDSAFFDSNDLKTRRSRNNFITLNNKSLTIMKDTNPFSMTSQNVNSIESCELNEYPLSTRDGREYDLAKELM